MLTPWHKTFHLLVFGSIATLAVVVVLLKQDFRARYESGDDGIFDSLARVTTSPNNLPEDSYGGSTPEETFLLFLAALQAGDADLASHYFIPAKQQGWQDSLLEIKKIGGLAAMYTELASIPQTWVKTEAGEAANTSAYTYGEAKKITFVRGGDSGKWRIAEL